MKLRRWIADNPWVWLLLIVFLFLGANAVFIVIASSQPPI